MKKILLILIIFFFLPVSVSASDIPGVQTPISYTNTYCSGQYYTYQQPLNSNSPTLADLFAGTAHFQIPQEAQTILLHWNQWSQADAQKMPILYDPISHKYYGYTRGYDGLNGRVFYNLFIFSSEDGLNFTEVGKVFDTQIIYDLYGKTLLGVYDPHIVIDYSTCPTRYILSFECNNGFCASSSETPFQPLSWSEPIPIVDVVNFNTPKQKSASTPVFLIDGTQIFASWTIVDTELQKASSQGISTQNPLAYLGSATIGTTLLPVTGNTQCTTSWDCNNRDKQDWKKEGDYYYLIYNGSNYFGCDRDTDNNWGISIVRSINPLSGYNLSGLGKILGSPSSSTCAVSYPLINNIDGELYMYYAYTASTINNITNLRSKLVWNIPSPTLIPKSGDLNNDGKVDIFDYNILVSNFGQPYTIYDYNALLGNFGK